MLRLRLPKLSRTPALTFIFSFLRPLRGELFHLSSSLCYLSCTKVWGSVLTSQAPKNQNVVVSWAKSCWRRVAGRPAEPKERLGGQDGGNKADSFD